MDFEYLRDAAAELTERLKTLSTKHLYVFASAYHADAEYGYPDRIIVEGIKKLRSTGKFTVDDRSMINTIVNGFCMKYNLKSQLIGFDPAMHNMILTNR